MAGTEGWAPTCSRGSRGREELKERFALSGGWLRAEQEGRREVCLSKALLTGKGGLRDLSLGSEGERLLSHHATNASGVSREGPDLGSLCH